MAKKRKTSPLNFYGYREQEDFEPQNNITEAIDNVKKEQKKTDTSQDEEIDSLQGQVIGLAIEVAVLKEIIEEGGLDPEKVSGITKNIEILSGDVAELKEGVANLSGDVSELSDSVSDLSDNVADLNNIVSDLSNNVSELEDDVSGLTEDIVTVKDKVSGLSEDVADLSGDVSNMQEKVSGLSEDVADLSGTVSDLKDEVSGLSDDVSDLTEGMAALVEAVDDIEDELSATTEALGDLSGKAFTDVIYNESGKTIEFFNDNGNLVGSVDTTAFVKDGMIDDVYYDPTTKELVIVFNTDAGKETIRIPLSDLFDLEAGDGIEVEGNRVSLKVDSASTDSDFITLSENGFGLSGITEKIEENTFWEKPSEEEQQEGVYTVLKSPNGTPVIKITNEGELFIIVEDEMVSVNDLLGQIAHEEY